MSALLVMHVQAQGQTAPTAITPWPPATYNKVIGYHFVNPSHGSLVATAVKESTILALDKVKTQEVALDGKRVKELISATFDAKMPVSLGWCYNPHHIFVFYLDAKPVAAIEVCFQCATVECWPRNEVVHHNNFTELAKLCTSLGFKEHVYDPPEKKNLDSKTIKIPPGLR